MKKYLLSILAIMAWPLVLMFAYEEIIAAYWFAHDGKTPEVDLFWWYLDDFVNNGTI